MVVQISKGKRMEGQSFSHRSTAIQRRGRRASFLLFRLAFACVFVANNAASPPGNLPAYSGAVQPGRNQA